jgi:hypothetical protein
MFQVWEVGNPATQLAEAGTLDAALAELDDECRRRHDQVAANNEGAHEIRYNFEIRDAAGAVLAWLTYSPDPAYPYESVIVDEMLRDAP